MPELSSIFAFYQVVASYCSSGAMITDARSIATREHEQVAHKFLSPIERATLLFLPRRHRKARLRKGELRFRAWESANPDVVAFLKRKAEGQAINAPCIQP